MSRNLNDAILVKKQTKQKLFTYLPHNFSKRNDVIENESPLSAILSAFIRSCLIGHFALKHRRCTFDWVSSPDRVVRSIQVTARKSQAA